MDQKDSKREAYLENPPKEQLSEINFYGSSSSLKETEKPSWEQDQKPETTFSKPLDVLAKRVLESPLPKENSAGEAQTEAQGLTVKTFLSNPVYQKKIHQAEVLIRLLQNGEGRLEVVKKAQKIFAQEPHFLDYFHDLLVSYENSLKK
jgi:hypothetical protein